MTTDSTPWRQRWQRLSAAALRRYHVYATWLVGISWKRFVVYAVLLLVGASVLESLPPFRWTVTETIEDARLEREPTASKKKQRPAPPAPPQPPAVTSPPAPARQPASAGDGVDISIQIDEHGIRITPRDRPASAPAAAAAASAGGGEGFSINVPANVDVPAVRQAVEEAKEAIRAAIEEQRESAREVEAAAREAAQSARGDTDVIVPGPGGTIKRVRHVHWGDFLSDVALLWIIASAVIKATYKSRIQAEVKAAQATETAEAESLKRQVAEARMAAMQAQVEPHFLFNTLASIDHLIETDPPRASQMQKNLIALLRASMPTMREASASGTAAGVRDLKREIDVIRPYLEILKVRMEERLATTIAVPDGLLSAEFPPMMIQTLVENAIKHGLEPKADGGSLTVRAEIVHGKLQVSVADTGLGFGRAATAGTGVGLANIRERLQLLYGPRASLTVAENQPSGTVVTVTVPYRTVEGAGA